MPKQQPARAAQRKKPAASLPTPVPPSVWRQKEWLRDLPFTPHYFHSLPEELKPHRVKLSHKCVLITESPTDWLRRVGPACKLEAA